MYCRKCWGSSSAVVSPRVGRVELGLDVLHQVEQGAADVAAGLGSAVPDVSAGEAAMLVAVGQFECAGRLARPGHAVKEHAALCALRGQCLAGAEHRLQPAHEPLRLGREGDAQPHFLQNGFSRLLRGGHELQLGCTQTHQDRRGRRQGRIRDVGGDGIAKGKVQCRRQRASLLEQFLVKRQHQVDGKGVAHRVAHGQDGTVQPLRQLLGQARQGCLGGLGQRRSFGPLLARGLAIKPELHAGRGVAARAAVAGVQDQQLQPRPRKVEQPA